MNNLVKQIRSGDTYALARAISLVENGEPGVPTIAHGLKARGNAKVVGITGPPGAGKSTLCNLVVKAWRARNETVGFLAVDPSSPFTEGALLGDRVRLRDHTLDKGVYIRSMAARGHLGGLTTSVRDAIRLVVASEKDHILLETVGVGQSEIEVMQTADTTVVVVSPVSGDDVQAMKAGILEVADVFVVNKAETAGADDVARDIRTLINDTYEHGSERWKPPVLKTTAAIDSHYEHLVNSGELEVRRRRQLDAEVEAIVVSRAQERARKALTEDQSSAAIAGDPDSADPHAVADAILEGGKTLS
jgi:LAO/AO transport system kinase